MSYLIDYVQDDGMVAVTFCSDFDANRELSLVTDDVMAILDQVDGKVIILNQFDAATFNLEDVIEVTTIARNQDATLFQHPKVSRIVGISNNKIVQLSPRG